MVSRWSAIRKLRPNRMSERLTDSQSTHEDYNLPRSTAVDRVTYLIACSSVKVSCNAWGHPARTKISKIVPKALAAPLSRSTSL